MKRCLFLVAYCLSPAIPLALYLVSIGGGIDSYSVSVMLGVVAFILICNQLILASRPSFAVQALGLKGVVTLHGAAPFAILAIAGAHRLLKVSLGFSTETTQATIGAVAWWIFLAAALAALALLAPIGRPVVKLLKDFRGFMAKTFRLDYKTARIFHNVTVAAGITILTHVLLASSSNVHSNPAGMAWMVAWLALALGMYVRYRLRGRKVPAVPEKE